MSRDLLRTETSGASLLPFGPYRKRKLGAGNANSDAFHDGDLSVPGFVVV